MSIRYTGQLALNVYKNTGRSLPIFSGESRVPYDAVLSGAVAVEDIHVDVPTPYAVIDAAGAHGAYATVISVHVTAREAYGAQKAAGRLFAVAKSDDFAQGDKLHSIEAEQARERARIEQR